MLLINFLVASYFFTEPAEVESEGGRGNLFYSKEKRIAEKEAHQIDYLK